MENLSAKQLIEEHNKMVASNNLENIYSIRMEIRKLTGSMSWDDGYKNLILDPPDWTKPKNNINDKNMRMPDVVNESCSGSIDILQECTVSGNVVKLPNRQLDRKSYLEAKKSLELIGGKWKGGKVMGFVFSENPTDLLLEISTGKKRNLKKEFQFFATPDELANTLVDIAMIEASSSILEPSAGQGALVKAVHKKFPDTIVDCFELMPVNMSILKRMKGINIIGGDFLESDNKTYDRIIANPPFSKNQDIDHIYKMYDKLNEGGILVSISSLHWKISSNKKENIFRDWLCDLGAKVIEIPKESFKESGTMVGGLIVVIEKWDVTKG